jgi:hypothetical protein
VCNYYFGFLSHGSFVECCALPTLTHGFPYKCHKVRVDLQAPARLKAKIPLGCIVLIKGLSAYTKSIGIFQYWKRCLNDVEGFQEAMLALVARGSFVTMK